MQTTNRILMVRPTGFSFDSEAARDNHFMHQAPDPAHLTEVVCQEFDAFVSTMREAGIVVEVLISALEKKTPNAVFPNNAFSTHTVHESGKSTFVVYPMRPENRRLERQAIVPHLAGRYPHQIDLTEYENDGAFLEGTGCLVLDRLNRIAYVNLCERAHERVARVWAQKMGYQCVFFSATDAQRRPIYHTNVMMSVGTRIAIVCLDSISDTAERKRVVNALLETQHEILAITLDQLQNFCGNVLELADGKLAMSSRAYSNFTPAQRDSLQAAGLTLVHSPLTQIENVGGGSARCCIAELF